MLGREQPLDLVSHGLAQQPEAVFVEVELVDEIEPVGEPETSEGQTQLVGELLPMDEEWPVEAAEIGEELLLAGAKRFTETSMTLDCAWLTST